MNQKKYNNEEIWNNVIGSLRRITGNNKTIELRRAKEKKPSERVCVREWKSEKVGELKK